MARYTVSALKVICPRDPKCHGFEVSGGRGKRCVGEVKFGDGSDDETLGMKGLQEDKKFSVFIKSRYTGVGYGYTFMVLGLG